MALTKVTGDFIKAGVITQAHLHSSHGITSTHISEGDKLFFTNARARGAISVSGNALSYNSSTGVITSNFEESPTFTGNVTISGTVTGGNGTFTNLTINAAEKLRFDGAGGHTYIEEDSNDTLIFATGGTTRLTLDADATFAGDVTVSGGDITLGGTGRIQGIDTVSAGTDAANKTYVDNQVAGIVDSAPSTLDTLNELAAALGDDANFSTTTANNIATKMPLAGGSFTGTVSIPSASHDLHIGNNLSTTGKVRFGLSSWNNSLGLESYWMVLRTNRNEGVKFIDSDGNTYVQFNASNNSSGAYDSTFKGNIITSGAAGDGTPLLTLTGSASATFNWISKSLHANLTAGETNLHLFGKATSTKNSGYIGYNWAADASNNNYVTIGQYGANHLFRVYGDQVLSTVTLRSDVDMQAPIFYDKDNTGYYVNPASSSNLLSLVVQDNLFVNAGQLYIGAANGTTDNSYRMYESSGAFIWQSRESGTWTTRLTITDAGSFNYASHISMGNHDIDYVNQLHFNDNVRFLDEGNDSYLRFQSGDGTTTGIKFYANSGNAFKGYVYGDNSGFGLLDSDGNWSIRIPLGGSGAEYRSNNNVEFTINDDHTLAHGSSRAPIFYDSNNTNFYTDPHSISVMYRVKDDHGNEMYTRKHSGSDFANGTLVQTDITSNTTNGASFVLEATGKSYSSEPPFNFMVQGYLYNNTIINYSGIHFGKFGFTTMKVFDYNGKLAFWWPRISYWNSFDVHVRNAGGDTHNLVTGISNSTEPSSSKKVSITMRASAIHGYNYSTGALYAGLYYDSNNTSYYVNPSDTTSLRTVGSWRADSSTWDGEFNGKIQHHGNYWYMQSANGVLVRNSSGANNIQLSHAGSGTASNDWRAPQFYDSADTGYYLNPNGISRLSQINISGAGAQGLNITSTDIRSSATSTWTGNPGANGKIQYHSNRWYIVGDSSSNRIVQFRRDSSDKCYIDNDGRLMDVYDVRAYAYYDRDNTSYVVEPAANSVMNTINGFGFSQTGGNGKILVTNSSNGYLYLNNWMHTDGAGIFSSVNGAHFYPNQSSDYGAWRIQGTRNGWTGITFEVSGYYQNVMASASTIGFYNDTENEWMVECQRNSHTRLYYNGSEQAKTDNGYFSINNALHTPIAYDSNNTGFYVDPASTSRVDSIMLRSTINFPVNSPGTTHGSGHRPAYGIYQEGGSWSSPFPDLCIAMHTGIKMGANASYNGIRFYTDYDMATQVMAINDSSSPIGASHVYVNNVLQAGSSLRTPVFYNSNNTAHYLDLDSTSKFGGDIHFLSTNSIWFNSLSTSGNYLRLHGGTSSGAYFDFNSTGSTKKMHWRQYGSHTRFTWDYSTAAFLAMGSITANGSDERLKENIVTIDGALDKVKQMRGVYFNRTDIEPNKKRVGFIAQEVKPILPEVVEEAGKVDGYEEYDEDQILTISYANITALIVEAVKEQQTIIDDLKSRIETLENQ